MDELKPEAKAVLDLARAARTPSDEDRARIERKLLLALGGGVAATSAAVTGNAVSSPLGAAASGLGAKLAVGLVLLTAIAGTVWLALPPSPPSAPPATATASFVPAAIPDAIAPSPAPDDAVLETSPDTDDAMLEPRPLETTREEEASPAPIRRERAPAVPEPDLAAEIALLHQAQSAWRRGDGARTLALLEDHEARFPRSQFTPERTALRILAWCQLDRIVEARRLGARFLRTAPSSPLRRSVEESCAAPERAGDDD